MRSSCVADNVTVVSIIAVLKLFLLTSWGSYTVIWPVLLLAVANAPPKHTLTVCLFPSCSFTSSARSSSSCGEGRCEQNRLRVLLKLGGGRQANRDCGGNRYPLWLRPLLLVRDPSFSGAESLCLVFCGLQTFEELWEIIRALFCNI